MRLKFGASRGLFIRIIVIFNFLLCDALLQSNDQKLVSLYIDKCYFMLITTIYCYISRYFIVTAAA